MKIKVKMIATAAGIVLLTACGGGGGDDDSGSGINALLGTVSFQYKFNTSSTIYRDTVTFTSSNLTSSGALASDTTSGVVGKLTACTYQEDGVDLGDGVYNYLCVITSSASLGNADIFWFNISNGTISGRYDYCIGSFSGSACVTDIALGPDGSVSGSVSSVSPRKSMASIEEFSSNKVKKEIFEPDESGRNASLTPEQRAIAEKIEQSLQVLKQ